MRKSAQFIYFLRLFGTGINIPVLSLILLARGATIETVSLVIGAYSLTVIAAEFPSGVFADLYGRKNAFLLSSVFSFLSYIILLFSRSVPVLLCGMVIHGLSRAFSSGSMEALLIDQATEQQVPLERVTARLTILESAGIASGALTGGLLAEIGTRYVGNLAANIGISALLILLTILFVRENPPKRAAHAAVSHLTLFRTQVKESILFARKRGTIRILLIFCLLMGFALNSIEIYWQPALSSFQTAKWVFGAISFGGFSFVMLGSWLSERLLRRSKKAGIGLLLLLKAPLGIGLILFSFSSSQFALIGGYLALYLLIGGSGVVENTLLNQLAPATHRASILSLFSLVLQIGGVIAAVGGFLISTYANYQNMWLLSGALLLLFSIAANMFRKTSVQSTVTFHSTSDETDLKDLTDAPESVF
jgi:MFS family permease